VILLGIELDSTFAPFRESGQLCVVGTPEEAIEAASEALAVTHASASH